MLTWLRTRPAGTRRAARPAIIVDVTKKRPAPPLVEEDMPPPFFADDDTAFLDMGDERMTPPPLPTAVVKVTAKQNETPPLVGNSPGSRLAQAVLALPPFPQRGDADRMRQLLDIFRTLDRIAGAACDGIETTAAKL
jgi:hypothetical protein